MISPMRRFGINVTEVFLSDMGNIFALLLFLLTLAVGLFRSWFDVAGFWGGVLCFATLTSGLLLGLGSGGVRQNRPALDLAFSFLLLTGMGWIAFGLFHPAWKLVFAGLLMVLMFFACWLVRREAIRARFTPRYFSIREFETMIQIADAMLDADDLTIHPIDVAVRTDHLLAEIDSPIKKEIHQVMFLIEWLTPFLVLRPFPFSDLGTHERREIIRKVIWSRGLFRDVSRTLKLLSTFTYYTHPDVRADVGYVEFDSRERTAGLDQTPKVYDIPVMEGEPHETL